MELRIKVKPIQYTPPVYKKYYTSRDEIVSRIKDNLVLCFSKHSDGAYQTFSYNGKRHNPKIVGIHLEKRRKKVKRTLITKGAKKGQHKSEVIHPNHWVANVYHFDPILLDSANVKIVQFARHFEIVPI